MKLRNKKTGEIGEVGYLANSSGEIIVNHIDDLDEWYTYKSLAELNNEWEDYEEPKEYYYLNEYLELDHEMWTDTEFDNKLKALGNYFETKEEAEKAVEKLKAWKRLKDKGVEFYGWRKNQTGTYDFLARWKDIPPKMHDIIEDLNLLFGGEE